MQSLLLRVNRITMKKLFSVIAVFAILQSTTAQTSQRPKLVVGIVVDQMRYDYLRKYWDDFENTGFRKLVQQGYSFQNAAYNYVPTYTGPGHASIYTGTTPAHHGIISNDWHNRFNGKDVYCASDSTVQTVGSSTVEVGKMSPRNMLSTTVGDELKIATNKRSKVIGVALKDRAAILPAGHIADGAYWFDGESGNFVSSTFYMKQLPEWLTKFNAEQKAQKYLESTWNMLLPEDRYDESLADLNPYESSFKGKDKPVFPYDLKVLAPLNGGMNMIRITPFGNSLTLDMAKAAITGENLGKDQFTDLLCVSFSSPDYIGHKFGTEARELQDCYLRLDRDLAELIRFAEESAGKGEVIFFLTADHGGATVPAYLMDLRAQGGYMDYSPMKDSVNNWLKATYKAENWLLTITNEQLYLNETAIQSAGKTVEEIEVFLANKLMYYPGIQQVLTGTQLRREEFTRDIGALIQRGYFPPRSGNVMLALQPNWMEYSRTGTTHGSPWCYDTRVPMLWYGWKIQSGSTTTSFSIDDIAPSLSILLDLPFPNATTGKPASIPLKN
jgi:predicted AlkP superfamily pyrophosphatase or phosphodiesterase